MTERERMALRLVEYRKRLSMSQQDFSKKIGKAQSVVSAWEKGQTSPDADMLPSIAKALEISISELCGQADTPTSDQILLDAYHESDIITQGIIKRILRIDEKGDTYVEN